MGRETPYGETTREDEQTPPAEALAMIRDRLWPPDDIDREWNGRDELEFIASVMEDAGFGRPKEEPMQAFTIPVAFLVEGATEQEAAKRLADILVEATLTQDHRSADAAPVAAWMQSWWMPNHPLTDSADSVECVLVWCSTGEHGSKAPHEGQRVADRALAYWNRIVTKIRPLGDDLDVMEE